MSDAFNHFEVDLLWTADGLVKWGQVVPLWTSWVKPEKMDKLTSLLG
jgi:hypothetical protein